MLRVDAPTALAFTPNGRLLITTQGGSLRVVRNGSLLATAALNLSAALCSNSERGLLGIAVDPAFANNRFIYVYYTFKSTARARTIPARAP
jgi:glucose/arabinose dehydrogenase